MVRPNYPVFVLRSCFREVFTWRGLNHLIAGLDYFRTLEYPLVVEQLNLEPGMRLLDVGSGRSLFPLLIASMGCEVWAIDIDAYVLDLQKTAVKFKVNLHVEVQDVQKMKYSEASFDRISAVSVLEHIPDGGDIAAFNEFSRILKAGGLVVVTVPFGAHEKERQKNETEFQRVYNTQRISDRFTHPLFTLEKTLYFGEKEHHFIHRWYKLPSAMRLLLFWAQPFFSSLFLKRFTKDDKHILSNKEKRNFGLTAGICLVYRRN